MKIRVAVRAATRSRRRARQQDEPWLTRRPRSQGKVGEERARSAPQGRQEGAGEGGGREREKAEGRRRPRKAVHAALHREVQRTIAIPALTKQFAYKNPMPGAAPREDRHQHGPRRRRDEPEDHRLRRRGAPRHHRSEAGRHARQEGDRELQAPRGPSHRRDGHAPREQDVGVPRSPRSRSRSRACATSGRLPRGFDGKGNYTLGLKEQIIFPEIDYDRSTSIKGMNISFVTTAQHRRRGARAPRSTSACRSGRPENRMKETTMARACQFAKLNRAPKFRRRHRNRCKVCGRGRAYYRKFELCRICLRLFALRGEIPA